MSAENTDLDFVKPIETLIIRKINELNQQEANLKNTLEAIEREKDTLEQSLDWLLAKNAPPDIKEPEFHLSPNAPAGYKAVWTWETKIKFIIEESIVAPLTTSEIVNEIMEYEPGRYERAKVVGSVSAVLSQKSKEGGVFIKTSNDRGEFMYDIAPPKPLDLPF